MRSIAIGLNLEENFFDSKVNDQCHNLRLLSYPPVKSNLFEKDGQTRAGAHSGSSVSFHEPFYKPNLVLTRLWDSDSSLPRFCWRFRSAELSHGSICTSKTYCMYQTFVHFCCKLLLTLKLARNNYHQCWRFASTLEQRCPAIDTSPCGCTVC